MAGKSEDREFVDLLLLAQDHGIKAVEVACEPAVEQNILRPPAISTHGHQGAAATPGGRRISATRR